MMSYLFSIKTSLLFFPFIAIFFTTPYIIHLYHKYGSINFIRVLIVYSFILYMMTLYFLIILPLPDIEDVVYKDNMIRLIPFGFIKDIINETTFNISNPKTYFTSLFDPCIYTVLFNVLMTIPFGMYMRYYFKCNLKKTIILTFLLSLFFELTQLTGLYHIYKYPYRVFDVDDLIMNTLGGIIGYISMNLFIKRLPSRDEIDEQSLIKGQEVSGLRRITVFLLDCFIFTILLPGAYLFINEKFTKYLLFGIYFILIPIYDNGKTIGSKFLNVSIKYDKYQILCSIIRPIFLLGYYIIIPFKFIYFSFLILSYLKLESKITIYFILGIIIFILAFYIINVLIILLKKKNFYDDIF